MGAAAVIANTAIATAMLRAMAQVLRKRSKRAEVRTCDLEERLSVVQVHLSPLTNFVPGLGGTTNGNKS